MSVPKITAPQFEDQIAGGITDRDNTQDTAYGPIRDIVITPVAQVLEQQNDRLRQVSQLISLENVSQFTEDDLNSIAFNEGLVRNPGSQAEGTVTFSRATAPSADAQVQRGFPIASSPDESTGQAITFVTTEARTLPAATSSSYFNPTTNRYELSVPIAALLTGPSGKVGPNRVNRPLRPLVNFDSVTNPSAIQTGGASLEDNVALTQRYEISVEGRQLSTPTGIRKYVLDNFPDVEDINTVYGFNPLLTRAGTDAGAVDAFVVATQAVQQVENITFLGIGQLLAIAFPPLIAVVSVQFGATTLIEGTDYEVVFDSSGVSGSTRDQDGIRILATTAAALVSNVSVLVVTYTYATTIRDLQAAEAQEDVHVFGRDLLYRAGQEEVIVLNANVTVASGFNPVTVLAAASSAIENYINGLGLGDLVEQFGIETAAGSVSGVQNFTITRLTVSSTPSGVSDLQMAGNQFPRITDATLNLTSI